MTVSYDEALSDVKARVNASRTSFHAGMAMLPKQKREAMYALYAFCRAVDDIADDGATLDIRSKGLEAWRKRIADLFRGKPSDPITAALAPAVTRFGLVEQDFQSIIDGMEMDAGDPIKAPDMKTLDLYCDRVASAVGRVSVRIFGDSSDMAMTLAHHLGRAFQMTNILRDLAEDAERGRLYLPEELLSKYDIKSRTPSEVVRDPGLPAVCRNFAQLTGAFFKAADLAMRQCDPAAMRPAKIMRAYYYAIFERLQAADWRDVRTRIALPDWQKLWLAVKSLVN